jgi:hypothetical protein|nr:MAG TPA: hypothetical protein [Caudoviricetes sp.]
MESNCSKKEGFAPQWATASSTDGATSTNGCKHKPTREQLYLSRE